VVSFLPAFPPISYIHYSFPQFVLYALLIHPPWLDHSNYIWRRVQVLKLLIMQFSATSHHFISLWSKYSYSQKNNMFMSLFWWWQRAIRTNQLYLPHSFRSLFSGTMLITGQALPHVYIQGAVTWLCVYSTTGWCSRTLCIAPSYFTLKNWRTRPSKFIPTNQPASRPSVRQ
jgi:hypothetical protein